MRRAIRRLSLRRPIPTTSPASRRCRSARPIEPPIRPTPTMATVFQRGFGTVLNQFCRAGVPTWQGPDSARAGGGPSPKGQSSSLPNRPTCKGLRLHGHARTADRRATKRGILAHRPGTWAGADDNPFRRRAIGSPRAALAAGASDRENNRFPPPNRARPVELPPIMRVTAIAVAFGTEHGFFRFAVERCSVSHESR